MSTELREIKVIKIYANNQGILTPPVKFIKELGWIKGQVIFIALTEDSLIVTDLHTFQNLKNYKDMRKTTLSGYTDNTKYKYFVYRITISKDLVNTFGLKNNCHVELSLEDNNKIVIKRHEPPTIKET